MAFNSATSALHAACLALDLGPGDRLWTSPISFVASAHCGLYCGAHVEFVDIDPATALISLPLLEKRLKKAEADGSLPKVLVPVHLAGSSCPMKELEALADRYGFRIIEDASHAVGASYDGVPVGSGYYSAITVFSFHPVKIITTGEGGAALSRDPELAHRMRRLRCHGISRDVFEQTSPGPWYYEQQDLGFNYRLTDLQASLGLSQLQRPMSCGTSSAHFSLSHLGAEFASSSWMSHPNAAALPSGCGEIPDASLSSTVHCLKACGCYWVQLHLANSLQPYYRRLGFKPEVYG